MQKEAFGYRAAYIAKTVKKLKEELDGDLFFKDLQTLDYSAAREKLLQLPGVGPKVTAALHLH